MAGRHDGATRCLGLEVHEQEALGVPVLRRPAGLHHERRGPDGVSDLRRPAARVRPLVDHVGATAAEEGSERPLPDDPEGGARHPAANGGPGGDEDVEALLLHEPPDEEDLGRPFGQRARREEPGVHPGGHHVRAGGIKADLGGGGGEERRGDHHGSDDIGHLAVVLGRPPGQAEGIVAVQRDHDRQPQAAGGSQDVADRVAEVDVDEPGAVHEGSGHQAGREWPTAGPRRRQAEQRREGHDGPVREAALVLERLAGDDEAGVPAVPDVGVHEAGGERQPALEIVQDRRGQTANVAGRPLRVLLVNDLPPGPGSGVEVHLDRLLRGLEAAGDRVELFAGEVAHRGLGRVLDVWDPRARRALTERARAFHPDVVHHHNVVRELSPAVLGVPRGVPTVLTVHDFHLLGVPDGAGPLARARALKTIIDRAVARRRVDAVVGVSAPLVVALRAAGFPRVVHLPLFVDPPPSGMTTTSVAESRDVVVAARLAPDKGIEVLIDAFAAIADRYPQSRLVVLGDGPSRQALLARAAPLGDRALFPGRVDAAGVRGAMAASRVVVAPSLPHVRPEGGGLTVLEAALLGRPAIVSDDPALRSLVEGIGGGQVVAAGSVSALAAALDEHLGDGTAAALRGDTARVAAEARHTTAVGVAHLRALYSELARRPGS